jgi:DUF4097 and DUF4098 domain-containing protein YvlB
MKPKWVVAGGLVVAELFLCGAIIFAAWQGVGVLGSSGLRVRMPHADDVSAEADEEQRAEVRGGASLIVENGIGYISLTETPGDEIVIGAHKTAWGADQAEAEARLAALQVVVTQTGNSITVTVERPEPSLVIGSQKGDWVDFNISVPPATSVTAHSAFGDIRFDNAEPGAVELDSSNGDVWLTGIRSDGRMRLSSNFGDITLERSQAQFLEVDGENGTVTLTSVSVANDLVAASTFGDIIVVGASADSYELHSQNGAIRLDGASGPVTASSGFGNIDIANAEAVTLDVSSNNGAISFAGTLEDGRHHVKSGFGNISLALPEDIALNIDLQSGFGDIESEFPVTVRDLEEQTHWLGTINGGGPELTVETDNGNIRLSVLTS